MATHYSMNKNMDDVQLNERRATNGGPLQALVGKTAGSGTDGYPEFIKFPHKLEEIDHWITFRAYQTKTINRGEPTTMQALSFIALPIPANLMTAYDINYPGTDLGASRSEVSDLMNTASNGAPDSAIAKSAKSVATSFQEGNYAEALKEATGGTLDAFRAGAVAVGADAIRSSQNLSIGAGAGGGIAANPHKVILFESVGLRKHSFSYKFFPQSYAEAQTLRSVIGLFKYHAAPSYARGLGIPSIGGRDAPEILHKHFFKYPEYWELDFHHPQFLFQIGASVLTDVSVDYHGAGVPSYARNNDREATPTAVELKLTFAETSIVTKENILSENR